MNNKDENQKSYDTSKTDFDMISKEDERSSLVLTDSDFGLTDEFEFDNDEVKSKKKFYVISSIVVGILLIAFTVMIVLITSDDAYIEKLTVYSDGIVISDYSDVPRNNVANFLDNKGYSSSEYIVDTVNTKVDVNTKVEGEDVMIYLLKDKSIHVTYYNQNEKIDWKNEKKQVFQFELNKVLDELDIVVTDNSIIYVDNTKVSDIKTETIRDGSEIRVVEDTTFEEVVEEPIPFSTEYKDDDSLIKGEKKVQTKGENGVKKITYKVYYSNGEEINREVLLTEVSQAPVTEVILRGTYEEPTQDQTSNDESE